MPNATRNPPTRPDHPTTPPGVSAAVEYHRVYAHEKRRVLRGLLAIVLLLAGLIGFAQLFLHGASLIDTRILGRTGFTPLQQAAGALAAAVLIPYCMLVQRCLYGVPARSLHSVAGHFRYGLFARALLALGPVVLIAMSVSSLLEPGDQIAWTTADLVAFFVIGMVLTPLAAAGEEYGFRGLMFRVVGGWTRGTRSGAVLGIVVTTVLFSLLHGALDPYILTSYLVLFGSMATITWRTGGLEVAVALHAVYNVAGLVLATTLHVDLGGALSSRAETTGSTAFLIPSLALILITAAVWWTTPHTGPARTPRDQTDSTDHQSLAAQTDALTAQGCERIFTDTLSGTGRACRGRRTVETLTAAGVLLRSLREGIDYSTPTGRMLAGIFASLAEYERDLMHERAAAARNAGPVVVSVGMLGPLLGLYGGRAG